MAQKFLLLAINISVLLDPTSRKDEKSDFLIIDLTCVACKVLTRFEGHEGLMWGKDKNDEAKALSCFLTCVAFLKFTCTFCESREDSNTMSAALSRVLTQSQVAIPLVYAASEKKMRRRIGTDGVLSILELFQLISVHLDKQVLLSLLGAGMRPALAANFTSRPQTMVIAGVSMRGYASLRNNALRFGPSPSSASRSSAQDVLHIGQDDCSHELEVVSSLFVACALRSAARTRVLGDAAAKTIRSFSLDYLGNCGEHLLSCLQQISKIGFEAEVKTVTIRSIREATSIFALIAELCRDHNIDEFKQRFEPLFKTFVGSAMEAARGLCLYLGSSAASRELFWALLIEDGQSSGDFGLSPLMDLSNARHEAIRFSHFVSRCASSVTEGEHELQTSYPGRMKPPSRRVSNDDPHSESAFERKCKENITNGFALTLEEEVAKCLFHALDVVWKTHPVRASYVEFSTEELRRIDPMRFIQTGSMISFREVDQRGAQVCVRHGEVRRIDIAYCTWDVAIYDGYGGEQTKRVPMNQLVGIEDASLRRPILKFAAAAENSAEMERLGSDLSTSHLIGALRWCHEYSFQRDVQNQPHVTKRLTEILGGLLGAEVSLAREHPEKCGKISPETIDTLAVQLLDLFGVQGDLDVDNDPDSPYTFRTEGRLRKILEDDVWEALRHQLNPELEKAAVDLNDRRENKRRRAAEGSGWLIHGSPYRNPRSPFRQLSY